MKTGLTYAIAQGIAKGRYGLDVEELGTDLATEVITEATEIASDAMADLMEVTYV